MNRFFNAKSVALILTPRTVPMVYTLPNATIGGVNDDNGGYRAIAALHALRVYESRSADIAPDIWYTRMVGELAVAKNINNTAITVLSESEANDYIAQAVRYWVVNVADVSMKRRISQANWAPDALKAIDEWWLHFDIPVPQQFQAKFIRGVEFFMTSYGRRTALPSHPAHELQRELMGVLALTITAFSKAGHISQPELCRLMTDMRHTINGSDYMLNESTVNAVFNQYRPYISSSLMRDTLTTWAQVVPVDVKHIYDRMARRAAWVNISSYVAVVQAMQVYPDFDWGNVKYLAPDQWSNFTAALELVGNDKYYGYNNDHGVARWSCYRRLAWVSTRLHLAIGAEPPRVSYYSGGGTDEFMEILVQKYIRSRAGI